MERKVKSKCKRSVNNCKVALHNIRLKPDYALDFVTRLLSGC